MPDAAPLGSLNLISSFFASGNNRIENNTANTRGVINSSPMIIKKPKAITDIKMAAKRTENERGCLRTGIGNYLFAVHNNKAKGIALL